MRARTIITIIAFAVIVIGSLVLYAWSTKPGLIDIYPGDGAMNISTISIIRMTFSRLMDLSSIEQRLSFDPAYPGTYAWDRNVLTFTPDQPWPGGKEIRVNLQAGGRAAAWLSFPMQAQSWSFTTSVATLGYLWPSNGPSDIYTLDPAQGEIHRYTSGMDVLDYTLSSDGIFIYFSAKNSQDGADIYQINRIDAERFIDGVYQPQKLLNCGVAQCRNLAVSSNRQYLAYEYLVPGVSVGLSPAQIRILSIKDLIVIPVSLADHEAVQPRWSSKGWLAFYDRTISAYEVVELQSHQSVQISNQTGQPGTWSIDGDYFLAPEISYSMAQGNHETGISHLIRYKISDASSVDLSGDLTVEDVEATYSPNGEVIAFTRKFLDAVDWTQGRQIWLMSSDGSEAHAITNEAYYNHYDLAWSSDGLMIAYVRFNQAKLSDLPELWLVNADGSSPIQLVIGGYSPIWMP
jgi:Tol biopolymer transport system component